MGAPKFAFALCVVVLSACLDARAQQTVYKWVDKDGKVQFSDTPPPDRDSSARRMGGGGSTDEQLPYVTQMAMKRYPVTVYTSTNCGDLCAKGRELLSKRGIPFTEKLPEKSAEDAEALKKLVGALTVPVMTVGENTVTGFDEPSWNSALDDAGYARARLPGQPAPKTQ
ncbi:MAG TPA: glutaredoxin family protein [Usitatibacter sp.]|jgi:glutaredoxin|nr:glutaredoxin family protein [Usitatibacter sp.]